MMSRPIIFRVCATLIFTISPIAMGETATTAPAFDDSPGWLNRITDTQLREAYEGLPADRQKRVDAMAAPERKRYLGGRYIARHRAIPADAAGVDPELRAIADSISDELEPRDAVINRILAYLAQQPQTPFTGDLYFSIAKLYSGWSRQLLGEEPDHDNALHYFRKAHASYGEKFCYHNDTAWASLANMSGSFKEQLAFYNWLTQLAANGTPDDVFPIREFEATFNGRPAQLTAEEKKITIDCFRKVNVAYSLCAAENNILERAGNDEGGLKELATDYSATALGQKASARLTALPKPK